MADQVVIRIGANASGALAAFGLVSGAAQAMANRVIGFGLNMSRSLVNAIPKALERADTMFKSAQSAGLNVEAFSALSYAAKLAGVGLEDLAVASRNSARQGNDFMATLMQTAELFERMPDGADKTRIAIERFGRSGDRLVPLLNAGAKAIRGQMQEAKALGVVISGDFGSRSEQFNDTLLRIRTSVEGLVVTIAEQLLPALQKTADVLLNISKNRAFQQLASELGKGPHWLREDSAFGQINQTLSLSESPYGPITANQQADFDSRLSRRRKQMSPQSDGQAPTLKVDKVNIQVPESRGSSAFTSRGFLSQGEAQMVSRTASFQKNVQTTLAEILGLQRQWLPKMAESLS